MLIWPFHFQVSLLGYAAKKVIMPNFKSDFVLDATFSKAYAMTICR